MSASTEADRITAAVCKAISEAALSALKCHDALLEVARMVDAWGNGIRHHTAHEAKMVKAARAALSLAAGKEEV